MRKLFLAGTFACLAATVVTPTFAQEPKVDASTVLAVVNGTEITMGSVILLQTQLPDQYKKAPDDVLFKGILDQLIDQTLLGATVTTETLEMKLSIENEKRALRASAAISAMLQTPPSEDAVKAAYEKAVADIPPQDEFNASHILLKTEDEAKAVVSDLQGGADFATEAKAKSTGPSGPKGGDLGWFSKGMMVPEFESTATALEVGAISAPVQTQFGWHVIKLNGKRVKSAPTLAEMHDKIVQKLQSDALDAKIKELRADATITQTVDGIDPAMIRDLGLIKP